MIIVAISHRNRQQRRALARALEKQVTRATGAQVRAHFIALVNYLRDANPAALELLGLADHADHALLGYVTDQAHGGEKVDLIGYRNLPANFERAQTEMLAQIARARGTDPIEHYVISWGDDEHPTPEQVVAYPLGYTQGISVPIHSPHSHNAPFHHVTRKTLLLSISRLLKPLKPFSISIHFPK